MENRRDKITAMYRAGKSVQSIAEMLGVSRQRIYQLLKPKKQTATKEERFWAKVDIKGHNDCWEWMAHCSQAGYGLFSGTSAHRTAWALTNGDIPEGSIICHKCDNRKCCNPSHLYAGSYSDNMNDMWSKNRHARSGRPAEKFTPDIIEDIIRLHASGVSYVKIAKKYHSSSEYVTFIANKHKTKSN